MVQKSFLYGFSHTFLDVWYFVIYNSTFILQFTTKKGPLVLPNKQLTFWVKTGQQNKKLWQTTGKGNTVCWLSEIEQTKQQYVPESSMALWSEEFIILSIYVYIFLWVLSILAWEILLVGFKLRLLNKESITCKF